MTQLTILADDLSGAADCGLQAVRHGLRSVVSLAAPGAGAGSGAEVLAWDLDTRDCEAHFAYEHTHAAASDLPPRRATSTASPAWTSTSCPHRTTR